MAQQYKVPITVHTMEDVDIISEEAIEKPIR